MRLRRWRFLLLVLLFFGTCTALAPVAVRVADPMTHVPLRGIDLPFPVAVMTAGRPHVLYIKDVMHPPPGSYLLPTGHDEAIVAALNALGPPDAEGTWVVHVERIDAGRERVELYFMHDGYSGGVYEATATSVRPLYRKFTGPGFGIVCGGLAILASACLCLAVFVIFRR